MSLPSGSDSKESACNAGDPSLITRSGRYPGKWNGNPLQYSCLENPRDRGAWGLVGYIVHRVAKGQTHVSNQRTQASMLRMVSTQITVSPTNSHPTTRDETTIDTS